MGGFSRRKACYIGLRAAAPLLRNGAAHFTLIGDGPERCSLEQLAKFASKFEKAVTFCGWLSHAEVFKRLRSADVVVLPAVREGGGGVVFEALASGAVPVILDLGQARGYRAPRSWVQGPPQQRGRGGITDGKDSKQSRGQSGSCVSATTARPVLRQRMLDLGCEGASHNSGPELGCRAEVQDQTFRGQRWRG